MSEQDIIAIRCPCCNEMIPVRLTLQGYGVDEGYIAIGGGSEGKSMAFPDWNISLDVDLLALRDFGIKEILDNMSDEARKLLQNSYAYGLAHDAYDIPGNKKTDD